MQQHITVVGALRIGSAVMGIMIAGLILLFMIGPGIVAQCVEGDAEALMILTALGIFCIWVLAHNETARMFAKPASE